MPKTPIEYANCKIYRIVCRDFAVPSVYVGHTTDMIRRRASHKKRCNYPSQTGHNCKIYQQIRENGGWDNWIMLLVEDYSCKGFEEAAARERYWAEQFEADLNTQVQGRSKEEWRQDNRENVLANQRERYRYNREQVLATQREYGNVKIKCACGAEYSRGGKSRHLKTTKHQKFISSLSIQTTDAETPIDSETNTPL